MCIRDMNNKDNISPLQMLVNALDNKTVYEKFGVETAELKSGIILTHALAFPDVFFLDMQVVAYQSLSQKESRTVIGKSLNDYLHLAGKPLLDEREDQDVIFASLFAMRQIEQERALVAQKIAFA